VHTLGEKQDVVVELARRSGISLKEFLDDTEKRWIIQELTDNKFNECATAKKLGWHRNTVSREAQRLKIPVAQMRFDFATARKPVARSGMKVAVERRREA